MSDRTLTALVYVALVSLAAACAHQFLYLISCLLGVGLVAALVLVAWCLCKASGLDMNEYDKEDQS